MGNIIPAEWQDKCIVSENGCWIWQKAKNNTGVPVQYWKGKVTSARKAVYEDIKGETVVSRLKSNCKIKDCVNPDHITPMDVIRAERERDKDPDLEFDEKSGMQIKRIKEFWSKVEIGDGCWNWKGSVNSYGHNNRFYGNFHFKGKEKYVHKIAYYLMKGEMINSPLILLRECNNSLCVNVDHMFVASRSDAFRYIRNRTLIEKI